MSGGERIRSANRVHDERHVQPALRCPRPTLRAVVSHLAPIRGAMAHIELRTIGWPLAGAL
eukprot:2288099-Pyramimonas_sp.AAC.1